MEPVTVFQSIMAIGVIGGFANWIMNQNSQIKMNRFNIERMEKDMIAFRRDFMDKLNDMSDQLNEIKIQLVNKQNRP